jgi:hypothetical protein
MVTLTDTPAGTNYWVIVVTAGERVNANEFAVEQFDAGGGAHTYDNPLTDDTLDPAGLPAITHYWCSAWMTPAERARLLAIIRYFGGILVEDGHWSYVAPETSTLQHFFEGWTPRAVLARLGLHVHTTPDPPPPDEPL